MSVAAQKILVRGVNWLGDAVMTTPALQRLREANPDAHITLLTHEKLAGLWPGHPSVDAVVTFAAGESLWKVGRRLRHSAFDLAVIFPNSIRSALEVFLAGVPRRIGQAGKGRSILLTHPVPARAASVPMRKRSVSEIRKRVDANLERERFPFAAHHVHHYLHLVGFTGANQTPLAPLLRVSPEEVEAFKQRFPWSGDKPLFGLNPGAEYGPAKRWPAERFVEVAVRLHQATGCDWFILGGASDVTLTDSIVAEIVKRAPSARVTNLAGRTSLRELCVALYACQLLLTNDTGPMHVAAAVGTRVIVPFGSTSPELTGPALTPETKHEMVVGAAACAPCFLRECPIDFRCMQSISVERILAAAGGGDFRTGWTSLM